MRNPAKIITWLFITFSILWWLCSLTGCTRTVEKVVEVKTVDTLIQTKVQRDSIYQHDSIYVESFSRGDTIFINKDRWHTLYKDKLNTDTLYITHHDTLRCVVTNQKEVAKPLSWWQRTLQGLGIIALIVAVGWVLYKWMRPSLW